MADNETEMPNKPTSAPYVGWPSYKSMLSGFKEHVLPGRVDRSVLGNFSGIVGTQLMATLRFFGQIDKNGAPTAHLERLVAAYGTDGWAAEVNEQLRRAYAPVFELNLQSASPNQFNEKFRAAFPAEGDTLRKALTFFLNATRDAGIPVSPFIMKNKKPRSSNGAKKPKAARAAKADTENENAGNFGSANGAGTGSEGDRSDALGAFKSQLLGKFPEFDPNWPDNIKAEWFKGFQQFMDMAKK